MATPDLKPSFTVQQTIAKPVEDCFSAFTQPDLLSGYFVTESTGALEPEKAIGWSWKSTILAGEEETVVLHVADITPNRRIVFRWEAYKVDYDTTVIVTFEERTEGQTTVGIHEEGWALDAAGLRSSYLHCSGWYEMLLRMKLFLEHGLDLRKYGVL